MSGGKGSRVVFIGNIPYGLTEEQIVQTFSSVGQVLSFRLVHDKDTGRPKGFGFAEFSDADAAASAVRNLNDFEIMGRHLKVDFTNDGGANDSAPVGYSAPVPAPLGYQNSAPTQNGQSLPPLPAGSDVPQGLTCDDVISRTLSVLPPPQLLDVLSQMKGLVISDPAKAAELLGSSPQLAYAIFQALILFGLVDGSGMFKDSANANAPPPPPVIQQAPIMHQAPTMHQARTMYQAPAMHPAPTMHHAPAMHHVPVMQQFPQQSPYAPPLHLQRRDVPTPPPRMTTYSPYPPPPMPPQPSMVDTSALLRQVMEMTPQQIDAMPPTERGQILTLRQQLAAQMQQQQQQQQLQQQQQYYR